MLDDHPMLLQEFIHPFYLMDVKAINNATMNTLVHSSLGEYMYRFLPPRIAMSDIHMFTFRIYSQTDFQNSFNDLYTHLPVA